MDEDMGLSGPGCLDPSFGPGFEPSGALVGIEHEGRSMSAFFVGMGTSTKETVPRGIPHWC